MSLSTPSSELVRLRDTLLNTGRWPEQHMLRSDIANSWRRCIMNGIDPGQRRISPVEVVNADAIITRASRTVMKQRSELLRDTPVGLLVADRNATVVSHWFGQDRLAGVLRDSGSEEGNVLEESVAGTNGVGTALEEQKIVQIAGAEHFTDAFRDFSCVGVPLRHPITRRVLGVLNMTCRLEDANPLLLPFALETAHEIERQLYLGSSKNERLLLEQFLSMQRRNDRPLVALNDHLVITNPAAARILADVEQGMLWELAAKTVQTRTTNVERLTLPNGDELPLRFSAAEEGGTVVGAVVEVMPSMKNAVPRTLARPRTAEQPLRGLAGRSAAWRQVEESALRLRDSTLPMLVRGGPGTGKMALISAMFAEQKAAGNLVILDGRLQAIDGVSAWVQSVRDAFTTPDTVVVLNHLETLKPRAAQGISALIDAQGSRGGRIVGVVSDEPDVEKGVARLVERLSVSTLYLPPLRDRLEDLPELLTNLSNRHVLNGSHARWTDEAVQILSRLTWAGNIRELDNLVRLVVANRHGGGIKAEHLPEEIRRQASRRQLTLLERLEFDAIIAADERAKGNKTEAAAILGISRATLYRKIRTYGINMGTSAF
ncbi:sigma-54-dependent Fis family transcriptional regulator [Pseudarthrobacter sp. SSS035]|uniref:sigma-54-dependent Fis family transcriptional regulator n=1 Tax=Pseudarthrobacter sp. SSS035 TaxID=2931399 RepID=UPI00200D7657|nr:helix-turn-helix domain-containing protein [Pseudarthrobacter sp. SSS035]